MKGQLVLVTPVRTPVLGHKTGTDGLQADGGSAALPSSGLIRIPSGATTVYFGGYNVDTGSNGVPFVAGEDFDLTVVNEILYGVAASTTSIYVLKSGD